MKLREVSTVCAKFAAVFESVQDWASKRKVNYIMTHSNAQGSLVDPTAEIRFPGIAVFLFIIAPFLLFFGFLTFMGASTRNYFDGAPFQSRSEEHTSELQSRGHLVCRLLLEKKK